MNEDMKSYLTTIAIILFFTGAFILGQVIVENKKLECQLEYGENAAYSVNGGNCFNVEPYEDEIIETLKYNEPIREESVSGILGIGEEKTIDALEAMRRQGLVYDSRRGWKVVNRGENTSG